MLIFKNEEELNIQINKYKKITTIISIIRLFIAVSLVIFLIMLFSLKEYLLYGIISAIIFILFIFVILFTNKYYYKLEHLKAKLLVYSNHKKRRTHDLNTFFDNGSDFLIKDDYKESDLDLFGKNSIYQYLNISKTKRGRIKFANYLRYGKEFDIDYAKSIYELSNLESSIDIEASIYEISNEAKRVDYEELLSNLGNKIKLNILSFIPLLSFIGMITYLILIFTISLNPFGIIGFILFNFISTRLFLKNNVFNVKATVYENIIDSYINICNKFILNKYESKYLLNYQDIIKNKINKLKSLKHIVELLSIRSNFVFLIIFNSLFISDFYTVLLFNKRIKDNSDLKDLFEIISELESMLSFANLGIDNDNYCIPEISDNISFNDLYHPLIDNPISNSLDIKEGIILTGSNMSGKTTFLRTLGIAEILFKASSIVPATKFLSPKLDIYTSLRANDMLDEGISTFYAEILRMKKINEAIKKGPCLVLIDEIFKGTNLNERLEASFKIIEKLNNYNAYFIISTHDEKITEAKDIVNYHFNEYYKDDKIYFDYKIKEGKSETTNAMYLLKMADII